MAGVIETPWTALFGWPNWVDAPAVSVTGGCWRADAPASLVLDPALALAAWSEDRHPSSTSLTIHLGQLRSLRVIALPWILHASRECQLRVSAMAGQSVSGSSGWRPLYQAVYPWGSLPYDHPAWFDGRVLGDRAMPFVWIADSALLADAVSIEVDDRAGESQSIGLSRVFVCPGWQPKFNISYGASLGVEDESTVQLAFGGGEVIESGAKRRIVRCSLDFMDEDEAMVWVLDAQREHGVRAQGFFCWNPTDQINMARRSFPARHRALAPIEARAHRLSGAAFEISEVLA